MYFLGEEGSCGMDGLVEGKPECRILFEMSMNGMTNKKKNSPILYLIL